MLVSINLDYLIALIDVAKTAEQLVTASTALDAEQAHTALAKALEVIPAPAKEAWHRDAVAGWA